jgi:hypothetical protein
MRCQAYRDEPVERIHVSACGLFGKQLQSQTHKEFKFLFRPAGIGPGIHGVIFPDFISWTPILALF